MLADELECAYSIEQAALRVPCETHVRLDCSPTESLVPIRRAIMKSPNDSMTVLVLFRNSRLSLQPLRSALTLRIKVRYTQHQHAPKDSNEKYE